jgi:hypothetical protein
MHHIELKATEPEGFCLVALAWFDLTEKACPSAEIINMIGLTEVLLPNSKELSK